MDAALRDALQRVVKTRPEPKPMTAAGSPAPILERTGLGQSASGAGIASPLTETSYESRVWYDVATLTSTDGILVFNMQRIKSVSMTDANGRAVVFDFKDIAT